LVNDPDILLADEPTGALDSETSVQVMELLKKVADKRLVVMVTHNPELAEQYSTRIVRLKDGEIISDSNPCPDDPKEETVSHANLGKAGMSLLTAMQLSFNNLWTKRTRTLLVAFAGSIGIIGIALISSLSNGANEYIKNTEEKTLSEYPLTISRAQVDMTSVMSTMEDQFAEVPDDGLIHEHPVVSAMYGTVNENDLGSLRDYLESGETNVYDLVNAIEYSYSLTPFIYKINGDSVRQVSPDSFYSSTGLESFITMMGMGTVSSIFTQLPENENLYRDQFELVAGHWPESKFDLVLVLEPGNVCVDLALYHMGLKDPSNLDKMIEAYTTGIMDPTVDNEEGEHAWTVDEVLGIEFKLVHAADVYKYDKDLGVWIAQNGSSKQMMELAKRGDSLKIAGIVTAKDASSMNVVNTGICYSPDLTRYIMEKAAESEIVKEQLAHPETNVFTGKGFDEDTSQFDLSSLFEIDEDAVHALFEFDAADIAADPSAFGDIDFDLGSTDLASMIDTSSLSGVFQNLSSTGVDRAFEGVTVDISTERMTQLFQQLYDGFAAVSSQNPRTDINSLGDAVRVYFGTEEALSILRNAFQTRLAESMNALFASEEFRNKAIELMMGYAAYLASTEEGIENLPDSASVYLATEEGTRLRNELVSIAVSVINSNITTEEFLLSILQQLTDSYAAYADQNSLPVPEEIAQAYTNYLNSEGAKQIIRSAASEMIDRNRLQSNLAGIAAEVGTQMGTLLSTQIASAMTQIGEQIAGQLQTSISTMMSGYMDNLSTGFNLSMDSLEDLVSVNMTAESMKEMLSELYSDTQKSSRKNLKTLGYATEDSPETITFYPIDFESKTAVVEILNNYNRAMQESGAEDKVVSFQDTVGTLMKSVTNIVNIIGYVLIAFVAISLIVSSIMIGVITYISVLERRKEIGILRAMGASRRNITQVFNSETIITGFLAGLLGVIISYLVMIPGNALLQRLTSQPVRAFLPETTALLLIGLSVVLTTIGGLIPSKSAARQDPVIALRSE
ncbi:MAG: FtsX-like permease family protein, partial [Lachnospiraceae bacterium]|nr:FtsX-like permease family protein [Lachnospiraceae bacterium]